MSALGSIIGAILKALLGFFQESRQADQTRNQLDSLTREAERSRVELEKARKNLDVAQDRQKIDETIRDLSDAAALDRLRDSVRKPSAPAA